MQRIPLGKLLGIAAVLLGSTWLWGTLVTPLYHSFVVRRDGFNVFLVTMVPLLSLPGALCLFFGLKLIIVKNLANIKGTIGSLLFLVAFRSAVMVSPILPDGIKNSLSSLVVTAAAIAIYVFLCKVVARHEGIPTGGYRDFVGRGILLLLCIEIWMLGTDLTIEYLPQEPGYTHVPDEPWGTIGFASSILAAWGFYGISARVLGWQKVKRQRFTLHRVDH